MQGINNFKILFEIYFTYMNLLAQERIYRPLYIRLLEKCTILGHFDYIRPIPALIRIFFPALAVFVSKRCAKASG
jgi:hypothetical protein